MTPIPFGDPPQELAPLNANFSGYALGLGVRWIAGYKKVEDRTMVEDAATESHAQMARDAASKPSLPLEHRQHDTFVAHWRDRELRADAYVTFALNPDDTIDQVKMRRVSPATDFSFDFQDLPLKPVGHR